MTAHDLGLLVLLGVGQMALGLALFTAGARLIPASEAALISLLEVVLGPLWVWIAFSEQPPFADARGRRADHRRRAAAGDAGLASAREVSRRLGTAPSSP